MRKSQAPERRRYPSLQGFSPACHYETILEKLVQHSFRLVGL